MFKKLPTILIFLFFSGLVPGQTDMPEWFKNPSLSEKTLTGTGFAENKQQSITNALFDLCQSAEAYLTTREKQFAAETGAEIKTPDIETLSKSVNSYTFGKIEIKALIKMYSITKVKDDPSSPVTELFERAVNFTYSDGNKSAEYRIFEKESSSEQTNETEVNTQVSEKNIKVGDIIRYLEGLGFSFRFQANMDGFYTLAEIDKEKYNAMQIKPDKIKNDKELYERFKKELNRNTPGRKK